MDNKIDIPFYGEYSFSRDPYDVHKVYIKTKASDELAEKALKAVQELDKKGVFGFVEKKVNLVNFLCHAQKDGAEEVEIHCLLTPENR